MDPPFGFKIIQKARSTSWHAVISFMGNGGVIAGPPLGGPCVVAGTS